GRGAGRAGRRRGGRAGKRKARPGAGLPVKRCSGPQAAVASALMRAARRLLWRAALFFWIRPPALKRSSRGRAARKAPCVRAGAARAEVADDGLLGALVGGLDVGHDGSLGTGRRTESGSREQESMAESWICVNNPPVMGRPA